MFMKLKDKPIWVKIGILVSPFFILILVYVFRAALYNLGFYFPKCPSWTYLRIYCPGCGNTRSVQHLLTGDVIGSIRYNPFPVIGIVLGILAYVEMLTFFFGRHLRIIPRNRIFWIVIFSLVVIYYIMRNFIAFF